MPPPSLNIYLPQAYLDPALCPSAMSRAELHRVWTYSLAAGLLWGYSKSGARQQGTPEKEVREPSVQYYYTDQVSITNYGGGGGDPLLTHESSCKQKIIFFLKITNLFSIYITYKIQRKGKRILNTPLICSSSSLMNAVLFWKMKPASELSVFCRHPASLLD